MQWPVEVYIPAFSSDLSFSTRANNLSSGGIQVSCNHQQEQLLIGHTAGHSKCGIRILLGDSKEVVEVQCRLVFNRRLSQDSYQLGFKILQFYGEGEALLDQYLELLGQQYRNRWC